MDKEFSIVQQKYQVSDLCTPVDNLEKQGLMHSHQPTRNHPENSFLLPPNTPKVLTATVSRDKSQSNSKNDSGQSLVDSSLSFSVFAKDEGRLRSNDLITGTIKCHKHITETSDCKDCYDHKDMAPEVQTGLNSHHCSNNRKVADGRSPVSTDFKLHDFNTDVTASYNENAPASDQSITSNDSFIDQVLADNSIVKPDSSKDDKSEFPLSCGVCSETFYTVDDMNAHLQSHCEGTEEKRFSCDICMKSFSRKANLNAHLRIHDDVKLYSCKICYKTFNYKSNLKVHMKVHAEDSWACQECSKTFTEKVFYSRHMRLHAESNFYCKVCCTVFNDEENYKAHVKVYGKSADHTSENAYICITCYKTFRKEYNLTAHVRTHSGYKPFVCTECKKTFSLKGNLMKHQQIHTGEKAYKCDICPKAFNHFHNLTRHTRFVHLKNKPQDPPSTDSSKKTFLRLKLNMSKE